MLDACDLVAASCVPNEPGFAKRRAGQARKYLLGAGTIPVSEIRWRPGPTWAAPVKPHASNKDRQMAYERHHGGIQR